MEQNKIAYILMALSACLILGACSSASEALGLEKKAPNEFDVVKRAPLAMPPGYALTPPRKGAPRPQEKATDAQAEQFVFGKNIPNKKKQKSSTEALFLEQAGADKAVKNIRSTVDEESTDYVQNNKPVIEKILKFGKSEPDASVLDAQKELERLKENLEKGRPLDTGETPAVDG